MLADVAVRHSDVMQFGEARDHGLGQKQPFIPIQLGQRAVGELGHARHAPRQGEELGVVDRDVLGALPGDRAKQTQRQFFVTVRNVLEYLLFAQPNECPIGLPD